MILRIVLGRFPAGGAADSLPDLRDRLTRSARAISGLESLIVGARRPSTADAARVDDVIEAAIVSVWRDAESMVQATAANDESFLARRLDLRFEVERTDHFEIVGRTFAALPPESTALLRILTVQARPPAEARLIEILRDQQPRLVELGLVASHLGRRVVAGGDVEATHVSVWPDRATIRRAAGGRPERPLFAAELDEWADGLALEMFDGIEITPRLPASSGPPILILDEDLRIVDITASAAAILGMPADHLVGLSVEEHTSAIGGHPPVDWRSIFDGAADEIAGVVAWAVPDIGEVILWYRARRDVPIPGRHAVVVRRHHESALVGTDLDEALAEAFGRRA